MTQPAIVSIKLSVEEVNLVLEHLMAGQYRRTAPVINSITSQAESQLELQAAAARIAADAAAAQLDLIPPEGEQLSASPDA